MTDELLIKFLIGEASSEESGRVEQWISSSEANRKHFQEIELIWNTSKRLHASSTIDEEVAWQRFQKKVSGRPAVKTLFNRSWLQVAAVLLLCCGSWLMYSVFYGSNYTTLTAGNNVVVETLPDGSEITLNKDSKLSYSAGFKGKQRDVKLLEGEVFFKVKPDKTKPFVIEIDNVEVTVLGTSFNVKREENSTEVIVETGIVRVSGNGQSVELEKDQKVQIGEDGKLRVEPSLDKLYHYYRTRRFVADNTPLWRVIEILNEAYKSEISIEDPELKNLPLSTTFSDESLEKILFIISETFDLKIVRQGNKIILKR